MSINSIYIVIGVILVGAIGILMYAIGEFKRMEDEE